MRNVRKEINNQAKDFCSRCTAHENATQKAEGVAGRQMITQFNQCEKCMKEKIRRKK